MSQRYVALPVRQQADARRTETCARAVQRTGRIQTEISKDGNLVMARSRGPLDPGALRRARRLPLNRTLFAVFSAAECLHAALPAVCHRRLETL